ncbi:MAG TPA: ABC transporter, partial [Chromatiaceae bacterium]|nr:ABC transporter [Chromatiaceae bacterium]
LLALLRERLRRDATALLHVTHQLDEALALGGRVLLLRAGRIGAELQPADLADMTLETLERWYLDAVTA